MKNSSLLFGNTTYKYYFRKVSFQIKIAGVIYHSSAIYDYQSALFIKVLLNESGSEVTLHRGLILHSKKKVGVLN